MENIFAEKVLDYFRKLEGTIEYKTKDYIGFKIYSKMYAEVTVRNEFVKAIVNEKYIDKATIDKLNINVLPDSYKWLLKAEVKIYDDEHLDKYLDVIRVCYEKTKKEYEDKIAQIIKSAIELNSRFIKDEMNREEFAFQKLLDKWEEFKRFNISNSDLDELKSDIESLDKFRSDEILNRYKDQEKKYNFLLLINEVVSYIDKNAYNKNEYNKYEDKRTLALTFVRQKDWVKGLISYKKYKDLSKITEVVRNVIIYINSPSDKMTAFKTSKINQFLKLLNPSYKDENNYNIQCENVFKELAKQNIKVKNEDNRGLLYGRLMFTQELAKLWDIENAYWKIQPYKSKGLSRDIVDKNLENNILVSSESNIDNGATNNIFYIADDNKIMLLGVFLGKGEKKEDGLYYRKFKKVAEPKNNINDLPLDKAWGRKISSKYFNLVKAEDKEQFEIDVLNGIFDLDIDNLIAEININGDGKTPIIESTDNNESDDTEDVAVFDKEIETPLNMILYGPPGTGKTFNSVNYAVSIVEKKEINEVAIESITNRKEVVNRYKKYLSEKRIVFTTFHQNYSYEDFIQGIRANTNNTDQLSFIKQDGIFKDLVERAKNDLENYYVIVIDEINRGNISRIFGELITLIEDDKRLGCDNETIVTLPSKECFGVPPNIFILGTMNTADKSIANIDIALRRRFDFIPMYTDYNIIPEFADMLRPINKAIYNKKRSADFIIGHAFFVNKTKDDIANIVNKKLIPLLNEYFYLNSNEVMDILGKGGIKVKENCDTFQLEFDGIEE